MRRISTPISIFRPIFTAGMRKALPSICSKAALKIAYDFSIYASRRLAQFPNVRLFDFRVAKEVTHDLNNYGDVIHHSPAIDLKVLSWLAAGNYVVSRDAPTASTELLKQQ